MQRRMFAAAALGLSLTACLEVEDVQFPLRVELGETHTLTAALVPSAGSGDPYFCARIPVAWGTGGLTYDGTIDGSTVYAGAVSISPSKASDLNLESTLGRAGMEWRCFVGPNTSGTTSGRVNISLPVTATTAGVYKLGFIGGVTSTNRGALAEHIVAAGVALAYDEMPYPVASLANQYPGLYPSVVWNGSQFVAGGSNGNLLRSSNGSAWNDASVNANLDIFRLRYAQGRYAAILENEGDRQLAESTNLTTWASHYASHTFREIFASPGTMVAVGDGGIVMTSWQPGEWNLHDLGDMNWHGGAYGEGRFLIAGFGGVVSTSTDAYTWTPVDLGSSGDLRSAAYGNGKFVLAGTYMLYASDDGESFTWVSTGTDQIYTHVHFSAGRFWLTAESGAVYESADGETWTLTAFQPVRDVASAGERTVFVTDDGLYLMAPGDAVLDRTTHNFGSVITGNTSRKQFQVSNPGTGDVIFGTLSGGAYAYSVENNGCEGARLGFTDVCTFDVVFAPVTVTTFAAAYELTVTWPTAVTLTVDVTGSGALTPPVPPNEAPSAPVLLAPADGASGLDTTVEFRWEPSTDPEGDAVSYELYVCENEEFNGCDPKHVTVAAALFPRGGMPGVAFAFVMFGFVFANRRRKELLLVVFLAAAPLVAACAPEEAGVSVNVGDDKDDEAEDEKKGIGETVEGLKPGTKYFWKVVAVDPEDGRAESAVWSFMTK